MSRHEEVGIPATLRRARLRDVLGELGVQRAEGELRIVSGARVHRILVRAGRVVAAHVAGRFDPLVARLRRTGLLDASSASEVLAAMSRSERRAGELARAAGVPEAAIFEALRRQLDDALTALEVLDGTAAALTFERREVRAAEVQALGAAPTRARPKKRLAPCVTRVDRRALRRLALELHPDRTAHLPERERRARAARFAKLTARLAS